ncbi:zinc ribbon domain-containing protein [Enterococcus faecium]|nr:zinc ribbon domain-containing protein [Enterococcus faecium]EMF0482579.1 zinc ribbon domain-containing protein [Enterococcus faecium]
MKFCSKCGEKLVDNHCPKCKGNTSKSFFNKKSVLVSLFGIIIICCSLGLYKNHVENEFIDNYNNLYSDSTKSVPNMDLDEQKVKKMGKSLWAVSGDKLEYKRQLADVREKVNVRDKVNQLFDEPIPDNFDSTYLTINSDTRIETPEIEGDDTFSKGLRSIVNYYNRQFDMLESVEETINGWDIAMIDLTDIDTLENSIQSINDTKLNDKANELARDIVTIKTDFEDYFNQHVGWHFNISDNQLGDIYHFNFPENELSWGAFQGSGMTGYMNSVKYDMKNKVYYIVTPLISMDKTVYDTTITPITLIDKDTISINNQIAMYDPEQVEAYNVFQNKPSAKVDAMKKIAFDTSAIEIASKDDATIYFSKFKDSIGLPEKVSYEFITEEKEMYEFNIRINSEGSEEVTNRAGTAIVYQNGYMTYKKAD